MMLFVYSSSPLWEISTGGTRVYIKQVASVPTVNEYESAVRKVLKSFPCDTSILSPAVLHDISQDEDGKWNLKNVATAGQPILSSLMKSVCRICQRFTIMYGSTEVLTLTYQVCERGVDYPDFLVGKPLPGVEIKVVDENGSMLKRGERGEAYVRSPSTFKGYLNDDKSTAGALTEDGWYRTDDSAIMLEDGSIIIEGRRSECLLRSGSRFITMSVAQIQVALKQHVPYQRCCCRSSASGRTVPNHLLCNNSTPAGGVRRQRSTKGISVRSEWAYRESLSRN
ncbi:hypothetical protein FSP39_003457 [Pinctada imbricata]|uniref:AMP-dependent synthetase/ligase domain-containing protein n=1 Tax=Pinctada imbricata TaxID=66713 RepID=A0AA88YAU4_PINIB|nr:hypothetical protein FSP39_003457 [Pinctada imbricata]